MATGINQDGGGLAPSASKDQAAATFTGSKTANHTEHVDGDEDLLLGHGWTSYHWENEVRDLAD